MTQPLTTELERQVRRMIERQAGKFPESRGVSFHVDAGADDRIAAFEALRTAGIGETVHIHAGAGSLTDGAALEELVLRCLAGIAWRRELTALGLDVQTAAGALGSDEKEPPSLRDDLVGLDRLGAEIVCGERRDQAADLPAAGVGGSIALDGLAYPVANACDFYLNIAPPTAGEEYAARVLTSGGRLALQRYVVLRRRSAVPLTVLGLLHVAERPGFEFLRALDHLPA